MIQRASFLVQGISVRHCWYRLVTENFRSPELNYLSIQIVMEATYVVNKDQKLQAF